MIPSQPWFICQISQNSAKMLHICLPVLTKGCGWESRKRRLSQSQEGPQPRCICLLWSWEMPLSQFITELGSPDSLLVQSCYIFKNFCCVSVCVCVCVIWMCVQVHVFRCRGKMEACYPFLSYFHETGSLAECRSWHFPAKLVSSKNQQFCCSTSKTLG